MKGEDVISTQIELMDKPSTPLSHRRDEYYIIYIYNKRPKLIQQISCLLISLSHSAESRAKKRVTSFPDPISAEIQIDQKKWLQLLAAMKRHPFLAFSAPPPL